MIHKNSNHALDKVLTLISAYWLKIPTPVTVSVMGAWPDGPRSKSTHLNCDRTQGKREGVWGPKGMSLSQMW